MNHTCPASQKPKESGLPGIGIKRIILDLASKTIKVDAVKNKDQQIAYVDGLPAAAMPSGTKLKTPASVSAIVKSQPPPPPPPPLPSPSPLNRKTLVPKTFGLTISNTKSAQLFYELRGINVDKFPIAVAVTFRSFVEAVTEVYCAANSITTYHTSGKNAGKAFSLTEKVEAVLVSLAGSMTKPALTAARTSLTSNNSVISVTRLNEYVHNPAMFPSKTDLIAAWTGVEGFFKAACK